MSSATISSATLTDTTVCIGCRSCQVTCKQWNNLPAEKTTTPDGQLNLQNPKHPQPASRPRKSNVLSRPRRRSIIRTSLPGRRRSGRRPTNCSPRSWASEVFPSSSEWGISVGLIAATIFLFGLGVRHMPVLPEEESK